MLTEILMRDMMVIARHVGIVDRQMFSMYKPISGWSFTERCCPMFAHVSGEKKKQGTSGLTIVGWKPLKF